MSPLDFLEVDDIESDFEFEDTPLVSLFLDSDVESNDDEVIKDMNEYVNTGYCDRDRKINKFDMRCLAYPCIIENVNPFGSPVPPNLPRDQVVQELDELVKNSVVINSRLENINHNQFIITPPVSPEQLLNDFMSPFDFLEVDDLESDFESKDTTLVSPFLDSVVESDDGFRQLVAYFDHILTMNLITRKAFKTIMVKELASRNNNLVAIVRNVHVFVGSFTYVIDFMLSEDIGEYIESDLSEVVMGITFKDCTRLEDNSNEGLITFSKGWDTFTY
nr:MAK10-like protein [Tanacetum cinerariifolium]